MAGNVISSQIEHHHQVAPIGIIMMQGTEDLCKKVNERLIKLYSDLHGPEIVRMPIMIQPEVPRFQTGDGKAMLKESVRGLDIYIVCDPGNYQ